MNTDDNHAGLTGEVALVTGGSGGLGQTICERLGRDGAAVVVGHYQDHESANEVVESIRTDGGNAVAVPADVTDADAVDALVTTAQEAFGPVSVLVNGATGPQPLVAIEDCTWQTYLDQLTFMVKAPLLLGQAVLGGMRERGSGRIVNIGSEVIARPDPHTGAYATAKAGLLGMTRQWARELGPVGIAVNMVAPGFVPVERHDHLDDEDIDAYRQTVPLGRMGSPHDIAAAVAFLASADAAFLTGQVVTVNGGRTFTL